MDQPYQAPLSSEPPYQPPYRSSAPATVGVLNIVFGIGLLLCAGCMTFYAVIFSNMGPFMAGAQQ